ncbi:hypothetical protein AAKU67_003680 [Oxalobacteraceae bacterium GrIS 2.11]
MKIKSKSPGKSGIAGDAAKDIDLKTELGQIEYLALLGKALEDNPDLPPEFIEEIFIALAEARAKQLVEYSPE